MSSISYKVGFYDGWTNEARVLHLRLIPGFMEKTSVLRRANLTLFLPDFYEYRAGFYKGSDAAFRHFQDFRSGLEPSNVL